VFALEHFVEISPRQDQKWQRLAKYLNAASTVLTEAHTGRMSQYLTFRLSSLNFYSLNFVN
jgi:hypothetical protein